MSATEQAAFTKKGLCIIDDYKGTKYSFLLELDNRGYMTWEEAMRKYAKYLPTSEQSRVMRNNRDGIYSAINTFGGEEPGGCWTSEQSEYRESEAVYFDMYINNSNYVKKSKQYEVRRVFTTPSTAATTSTTTTSATPVKYSTTPINLSLCVEMNGRIVYITQPQWEAMSATLQASCHKKGLCLIGKNEQFLLALDENSEKINWTKATQEYGKRLPTHDQAKVISENWKYLDKALTVFGASELKNYHYWTSSSYDKKSAYYIINFGSISVSIDSKKEKMYVRTVEPIPEVP